MDLLSGDSNRKFNLFCSKSKNTIIGDKNGPGEKKIFFMEISKEPTTNYVFNISKSSKSTESMINSNSNPSLGNFNIKIFWSLMRKEKN